MTGLKGAKRESAKNHLINHKAHHFHQLDSVVDNLMHNFASLYQVKQVDKKINGFTYSQAQHEIRKFADENFEALRIGIKNGNSEGLDQLASRLRIKDTANIFQFKHQAKPLYKTIYLELVIVTLMVNL